MIHLSKGDRFGRLIIIKETNPKIYKSGKARVFTCKCDCGNTKDVKLSLLRSGETKSCGCLNKELVSKRAKSLFTTHGLSYNDNGNQTKLYRAWRGMKTRCYNESHHKYKNYGGKGIKVCDEWLNSYKAFHKWSFENGYYEQDKNTEYKDLLSLDRKESNKDYSPENCQWITVSENTKRVFK